MQFTKEPGSDQVSASECIKPQTEAISAKYKPLITSVILKNPRGEEQTQRLIRLDRLGVKYR